jgi:hypothetical protein
MENSIETSKRRRIFINKWVYKSKATSQRFKKKAFTNDPEWSYALHLLGIDERKCLSSKTFENVIGVTGEAFMNFLQLGFLYYGEVDKYNVFVCDRRNNRCRLIGRLKFNVVDELVYEHTSEVAEFLNKVLGDE